MDVFDLQARISVDVNEYEHSLSKASGKTRSFASKLAGGLGKAAKVGGAALTAASAVAGAFVKKAVDAGKAFDSSMAQVAATMGKSMDEMKNEVGEVDLAWGHFSGNLRDYAQEMGAHTAFSAKQAADALNYMALAGYDVQKSMKMLPTVLNLAAAGNMDLAQASDMVTDAQTALGLNTQDTVKMVDQMAKTAATTNTSVAQLGSAFLTIGATARDTVKNHGTGELARVLGILADNGMKASVSGTHLRNMITKLTSPTKNGRDLLNQFAKILGHDLVFDEKTGEMREFKDIFLDLNKAMEGATDKERNQALSQIFNARDLRAANALLGTSAKRWDKVAKAIGVAEGSAQKMADTQLDNLEGDVTLFKSALEGTQIVISDKVTPTLREFVQFGSDGLSKLTEAIKGDGLNGAMDTLGTVISDGLRKLVDGLPVAIEAGGRLLMSLGEGIANAAPNLVDSVVKILETLVSNIKSDKQSNKFIEAGKKIFSSLLDGFKRAVPLILEALPILLDKLVKGVLDLGKMISAEAPALANSGVDLMAQLVGGVGAALPELLNMAVEIVLSFAIALTTKENIDKMIKAALELIKGLAQGLINALPQIAAAIPKIILGITQGLLENVDDIIKCGVDLMSSLFDNLDKIIENLDLAGLVSGIIDSLLENSDDIIDAGFKLMSVLFDNMDKILEALGKAVRDIVKGIYKALIEDGGLQKIIRAGFKIAGKVIKGMLNFVASIPGRLAKFIEGIVNYFKTGKVIDDLKNAGKAIIETLWQGLEGAWKGVSEWISGIVDWAGEQFKKIVDFMQNIVSSIGIGMSDADAAEAAAERKKNREQNIKVVNAYTSQNLGDKGYSIKNEESGTKIYDSKGNDVTNRFVRQSGRRSSRFDLAPTTNIKTTQKSADLSKQIEDLSESIDKLSKSRQDTQIILNNRELGRAVRSYA